VASKVLCSTGGVGGKNEPITNALLPRIAGTLSQIGSPRFLVFKE
jgi:hypothetical protein